MKDMKLIEFGSRGYQGGMVVLGKNGLVTCGWDLRQFSSTTVDWWFGS